MIIFDLDIFLHYKNHKRENIPNYQINPQLHKATVLASTVFYHSKDFSR